MFESQNVSPDLLLASQDLAQSREAAFKGKRKLERIQGFIQKVTPFEVPADPEVIKLQELKKVRNSPAVIAEFERKISEMESRIKKGEEAYARIIKEFESIDQERAIKDQGYTQKIASIFNIPQSSVKDIIQACSSD